MADENYNDLFEKNEQNGTKKDYDRDEWVQRKKNERTDLFNMMEEATEEAASSPEAFAEYLDTQAVFDRYSVANCLLISKQCPDAVQLADYETWKEKGIQVQRGESAILIMEPGQDYVRENGSMGVSMNIRRVFDISQTTAAAEAPDNVLRHPMRSLLKAVMEQSPVDIRIADDLKDGVSGAFSKDENSILIRRDLSGDEIFKTLAYEIMTVNRNERGEGNAFLASASCYVLCRRYGINTGGFDFSGAADYFSGKAPKDIRTELETVRRAAHGMTNGIEESFERIQKARHDQRTNQRG